MHSLMNIGGVGLPIEFPDVSFNKNRSDSYVNVDGDEMKSEIDMNSNRVKELPAPLNAGYAVNKLYVDLEIEKIKKLSNLK